MIHDKKAQSFPTLKYIIIFWSAVIFLGAIFGQSLIRDKDPYDTFSEQPQQNSWSAIWQILTFQVTGVEWFISIIVWAVILISVGVTIYAVRGVW